MTKDEYYERLLEKREKEDNDVTAVEWTHDDKSCGIFMS